MSSPRRTKLALLALALLCGLLTWRASQRLAQRPALVSEPVRPAQSVQPAAVVPAAPVKPRDSVAVAAAKWVRLETLVPGQPARFVDAKVTNRFRNTAAPMKALERNDRAVLFRNALIDTASGEPLALPAALQSEGDPGAYVVQAKGLTTDAFRRELQSAGLEIVSYIPNNAYLVRGARAAAEQAATASEVAAVLPYEPAFKLEPELLHGLLAELPPAGELKLILTVPDPVATLPTLLALGATEDFQERGPFGTLVTVTAPAKSLAALAQLSGVQMVERWSPRAIANDLTGPALGSTTNALNTSNYFGLTGEGVLININDTGVDASHPDLQGRVSTLAALEDPVLLDLDGHGTHVAGTIAGNGTGTLTGTPQGSPTNASLQGKAPKAKLFVLPIDLIQGPPSGDAYLQEEAAKAPGRTNRNRPLISNNSWAYTTREYTSHSASYDAAVRDALPRETGSQPILYVFAAGNEGSGGDSGVGGVPDSIASPSNAKNVITVGALESPRNLTNAIVYDTNGIAVKIGSAVIPGRGYNPTNQNYFTNEVLRSFTDTDYQVAGFSSRGNVGVEIEGEFGRFKPDVVAPGAFILSARSSSWLLENQYPRDPFTGEFPDAYYLFKDLEDVDAPDYRFESGTSMAAPAISGLLAQMQEFFGKQSLFPSASSYKALLINSSLATSETYEPDTKEDFNYGGWGQPNLLRALHSGFKGTEEGKELAVVETPPNRPGLATAEVRRFRINMTETNAPLRLTLVWTDPPGNPSASTKLVNDLDLVVSNTVTGEVFFGNDFTPGTGFSRAQTTNEPVAADRVNNVERIVLKNPLSTVYEVTVIGYRVNVNARWDHPDQIAQDFSLVLSADVPVGEFAGSITSSDFADFVTIGLPSPSAAVPITNGVALFNQKVGANSPLIGGAGGTTNQWRFFTFTNIVGSITNNPGTDAETIRVFGSNVAFVIFPNEPTANLARTRTNGPDLDLYVSRSASLTNLDASAIGAAWKATSQGATELIALTNQPQGDDVIFYVGVKSEDQQAGEFSFFGISTDQPFTTIDKDGFPHAFATRISPLPDGSPDRPGIGQWIAISLINEELRRVTPTVTTMHPNFPDLLGQLRLGSLYSVLNNHGPLLEQSGSATGVSVLYDDSGSGDFLSATNSRPTDGPGALGEFMGVSGGGPWFLTTVDNALGNDGEVTALDLRMMPNDFGPQFVERCVRARLIELEVFNVPVDANRLTITITNRQGETLGGPLEVYIRRDAIPDILNPANNDKFATVFPPNGGDIVLSLRDVPPLTPGRYFIAVYNPNNFEICYRIRARLERGLDGSLTKIFNSGKIDRPLADGALTDSAVTVNDTRPVTAIGAGVRIDHPRVSDLEIRLVNPQGDRTVLFENRGRTDAEALGSELVTTNGDFSHVAFTFERSSGRTLLYVNGRQVAEQFFPGLLPVTTNAMLFATDGFQRNAGPLAFDDFGLWKRALTSGNVRDLYRYGVEDRRGKVRDDSEAGLLAWWPFDGVGSELLHDFTVDYPSATAVPGQIGQALEFGPGQIGFIEPLPELDVMRNTGFTLEGWVKANTNFPTIIAGWAHTNGVAAPLLVANFPPPIGQGPGSFSVLFSAVDSPEVEMPLPIRNAGFEDFTGTDTAHFDLNGKLLPGHYSEYPGFPIEPTGVVSPNAIPGWTSIQSAGTVNYNGTSHYPGGIPEGQNCAWINIRGYFSQTLTNRYEANTRYRLTVDVGDSALLDFPGYTVGLYANGVQVVTDGNSVPIPNGGFSRVAVETTLNDSSPSLGQPIEIRLGTFAANTEQVAFDNVQLSSALQPTSGTNGNPVSVSTGGGLVTPGATVTNTLYAVFTELTNVTSELIKFAVPPFVTDTRTRVLASSTFDIAQPSGGFGDIYFPPTVVDGWTIFGGVVQWLTDGELALSGNTSLELFPNAQGGSRLRRTFTTTPGRFYSLSMGYRRMPRASTNEPGSAVQVLIGTNVVSTFVGTELWQTNSVLVQATNSSLTFVLVNAAGNRQAPTLLDEIRFIEEPNGLYLPEEPLRPLAKGPAVGDWRLEVTDGRAGEIGELLSWEMQLTFAPTNPPAYRLTGGVSLTTNVVGDALTYFIVDVPPEATITTNTLVSLSGGPLNLLFAQNGLPDGLQAEDYYLLFGVQSVPQAKLLFTNVLPPFKPGQRYYLGVQNSIAGQSNQFAIRVDFGLPIQPLTNNVAFAGTNANRGFIDYYSFNVTPGALGVRFSVSNLSGDVNLIASKAPGLPTRTVYAYASTNVGTVPESIQIDPFSQPVPLEAGLWYLGVYPADSQNRTSPITYTITATELSGTALPLTNGVPLDGEILADGQIDYYYLDLTNEVASATFIVTNLTGDVNLFLRQGLPLPSANSFDFASANAGLANEGIFLLSRDVPQLLTPGRWFMAVVASDPAPVSYTITASFALPNSDFELLVDSVPQTSLVTAGPTNRLYRFDVPFDSTTKLLFELYGLDGAADLFVAQGSPPDSVPDFIANLKPGQQNELIVVTNGQVPQLGGQWYVDVRFSTTNQVNYTVRAATRQNGLLEGGIPISTTYNLPTGAGQTPFISWNAIPGETYQVQYTESLDATPLVWLSAAPPVTVVGELGVSLIPLVNSDVFPVYFYRVIQLPSP